MDGPGVKSFGFLVLLLGLEVGLGDQTVTLGELSLDIGGQSSVTFSGGDRSRGISIRLIVFQLGAVHVRMLAEAILHTPVDLVSMDAVKAVKPRYNVLELLNALNTLGLLVRVHEAGECCPELLSARAVGHTAQAWAVPVDLASLRVKSGRLGGLLRVNSNLGVHLNGSIGGSSDLRGRRIDLRLRPGSGLLFTDLGGDRLESGEGRIVGFLLLGLAEKGDYTLMVRSALFRYPEYPLNQ
jgi:hypothetical protein